MRFYNSLPIPFAVAILLLSVSPAHAQSIRCVQEDFIAEFPLEDRPTSYAILDNDTLAVYHDLVQEIRFYDISEDAQLPLRSSYALQGSDFRTKLHANGNHIYVCVPAGSSFNLLALNVEDPSQPILQATLPVPKNMTNSEFVDDTAYFINDNFIGPGAGIFHAYDITDPDNPIRTQRINMGVEISRQQGMQISGGLMHLSTPNRLMTYSVDALGHVQWLNTLQLASNDVLSMEAREELLFVQHADQLIVFDFTDPASPIQRSQLQVGFSNLIRLNGQSVFLNGNSISAIDLADPDSPFQTGIFQEYAYVDDILIHDNRVFVARNNGLSVYGSQIQYSTRPQETLTFTGGNPHEMVIRDNLAYIASGNFRMRIYNIADPYAPFVVNSIGSGGVTPVNYTKIDANDSNIVVVDDKELVIFSIKNPQAPAEIAAITDFQTIRDIDLDGQRLAVVGEVETDIPGEFECVLSIYDMTNPVNPTLFSMTEGFNTPNWIELSGDNLIVFDPSTFPNTQFQGFFHFDVSDISNPVYINRIQLTSGFGFSFGNVNDIVIRDEIGYVSTPFNSISILDVSNPNDFQLLAEFPTGFTPDQLSISNDMLIVEANGLYLYDITDPISPRRAGSAPDLDIPTNQSLKPHIVGDTVIATHLDIGLVTYDISECVNCTADLNNDNQLSFFDVAIFIANYLAQDPAADFNSDGIYNFFDVSEFLIEFNSGCP